LDAHLVYKSVHGIPHVQVTERFATRPFTRVWVNDASAYQRSLTQTAGDGRRFRVTARDLSKVANCNFSSSSLSVLGLPVVSCYRPLRCLMFNVTVVIISTTTQLQSDVDRVVHFRLT